jgi:hypothetical protein
LAGMLLCDIVISYCAKAPMCNVEHEVGTTTYKA